MANKKEVRITEDRVEAKYFTITPRLVWALSRDTYDLGLWFVIKDVAGETGECYLSRSELAEMSMMSEGKVTDCRDYLIDQGLLEGEVSKDPGYPNSVWHLHVPDFMSRSIRWSRITSQSHLALNSSAK